MNSKDKKNIKVYENFAFNYINFLEERLPQFILVKFISMLNRIKSRGKKKVLDAGCSGGRDVEYLKSEGFNVTGIDLSEKIIKEAKKRVKRTKFFVMDIKDLDFKKEEFHGIWCYNSLVHVSKKDLGNTIKGFYDVLKKQGIICLTTIEGDHEGLVEKKELGNKKVFWVLHSQKDVEEKILEAGFEILNNTFEKHDNLITIFARKN